MDKPFQPLVPSGSAALSLVSERPRNPPTVPAAG